MPEGQPFQTFLLAASGQMEGNASNYSSSTELVAEINFGSARYGGNGGNFLCPHLKLNILMILLFRLSYNRVAQK